MANIDEFESVFKSAAKPVFQIEPITIDNICVVTDQMDESATRYADRLSGFVEVLNSEQHTVAINTIAGNQFSNVTQLLEKIEASGADLVCTHRNLHSPNGDSPYTLGEYVDVLTQSADVPVLLTPAPASLNDAMLTNTDQVMLMTDHLAGDSQLVTYGSLFTESEGRLTLVHIEDQQTFERYIDVIGKIPNIDTEMARHEILEQLLKEPKDYVGSCIAGLKQAAVPLTVDSIITVGHHLNDYKKLVVENQTDLLIMHTKDEDQLAMHGLAYPVSVELREVPLLLI